jgi:peptidoglycan/LPS O-acetylase OafA/YrhL
MQRIASLDGLRAISIILVMIGHLVKWGHISLKIVGSYDSLGVHVFFVLSGYLITMLLLKEHERTLTVTLTAFYVRRAFRIFPAALVFLAIVTVLHWHEMRWSHLAAALLYVANMDYSRPWVFGHLWSLSIEEQFYLIWPLAVKRWYRHRTGILLVALAITPLFRACLYALKVRNGIGGSLPVFADQLAIGCLLAVLESRIPKISKSLALSMLFAVAFIPWFPANTPGRTLFMLFVLRPLLDISLAGLVLHAIQVPYRALNWTPITWLGRISYSLYLWQELFCSNAAYHLGYSLILPSVACACVSYYAVEKPMLRLRDRLFTDSVPSHASIPLAGAEASFATAQL